MSKEISKTFGHYSPFTEAGGLIFIAGQVGADFQTKYASIDIIEQTNKALDNLEATLKDAGLGLEHVIKTTIFLTDMSYAAEVNKVYAERFTKAPLPARSMVAVRELPRVSKEAALKIEIEAIASRSMG